MSPATPLCNCPACRWRSLRGPLVLIALGVLLLLHMTQGGWTGPVFAGAFLIFLGALPLVENVLPRGQGGYAHRSSHWAGPILLVAIGAMLVAVHAVPGFRAADWIARYWPVLFIVWGVGRLVEFYTVPGGRRSGLSGGEIVLLIILVMAGFAFSGAYRLRQNDWVRYMGLHIEDWNPMFTPFNYNATATATLAPGQRIEVAGYRGSVRLIAAPAGSTQVSAVLDDRVHAPDQQEAERLFQSAQPHIESEGGALVVWPAGDVRNGQIEANLQLTVPAATAVEVTLNSGDIRIDDWQAPLNLTTGHGLVQVRNLKGDLALAATRNSVDLEQINGAITVHGTGENVTFSDITGKATLNGEYSGTLRFHNIAGGLSYDSMRTTLDVGGLPGDLDGSLGRFDFRSNAVNIRLETRDKQLSISSFRGPLDITDSNSSIRLDTDTVPNDNISVSTTNGDIELALPAASRFNLHATARNGDIHTDFGIDISHRGASASADDSSAAAPQITLNTRNGSITLRKR